MPVCAHWCRCLPCISPIFVFEHVGVKTCICMLCLLSISSQRLLSFFPHRVHSISFFWGKWNTISLTLLRCTISLKTCPGSHTLSMCMYVCVVCVYGGLCACWCDIVMRADVRPPTQSRIWKKCLSRWNASVVALSLSLSISDYFSLWVCASVSVSLSILSSSAFAFSPGHTVH